MGWALALLYLALALNAAAMWVGYREQKEQDRVAGAERPSGYAWPKPDRGLRPLRVASTTRGKALLAASGVSMAASLFFMVRDTTTLLG